LVGGLRQARSGLLAHNDRLERLRSENERFATAHILSAPKPASGTIETCPAAPTLTTFRSKHIPLKTLVESHLADTPQPATVADESASGFVVAADMTTPFSGSGSP